MAVPKKKTSQMKKGLRHAGQHHKLYPKHPISCPNCGDLVLPLHVCPACGTYKGKEVIEIKAEEDSSEEVES
jgi:large subunit ribosomal protein L32